MVKRAVGEQITRELIFDSFVASLENIKIYAVIKKAVQGFPDKDQVA